ncbi:MAG: tyrosine-type recombinase/integrase [Clostridia bacterium]|nr:tyrosine-type recombinase/integrase [Clostridia bacterium]
MKKITNKEIMQFKEYLLCEEKSEATTEKYIRDLTVFSKWSNGKNITKELVLSYKQEISLKYAPASVNSMLSSINNFFTYKAWHELKVKSLKIQKPLYIDKSKELTKKDYQKLLETARNLPNPRLYYLLQTICACGIRVSELKFITTDALNIGKSIIRSKGKTREILIPLKLCTILKKYASEKGIKDGPVFVTYNGRPLDRTNIWVQMKNLCKKSGIPAEKVYPHNLRHLFARTFYASQKDVVRLADILGHSSVNTTRIYTMENSDVHRRQMQNLGLFDLDV